MKGRKQNRQGHTLANTANQNTGMRLVNTIAELIKTAAYRTAPVWEKGIIMKSDAVLFVPKIIETASKDATDKNITVTM